VPVIDGFRIESGRFEVWNIIIVNLTKSLRRLSRRESNRSAHLARQPLSQPLRNDYVRARPGIAAGSALGTDD
jgi:hypothetical protein